ncbi:MAG: alpha-amylase family glycosyl hydrolase, partial [Methanomassiliicoccales archaeon]
SHDVPRICSLLKGRRKVELALALLFALPGAPAIYYGDEFGIKGKTTDSGRATVDWSRRAVFAPIIASLKSLRDENPALIYGRLTLVTRNRLLVVERSIGRESVIFICNCSPAPEEVLLKDYRPILGKLFRKRGACCTLSPDGWLFASS